MELSDLCESLLKDIMRVGTGQIGPAFKSSLK